MSIKTAIYDYILGIKQPNRLSRSISRYKHRFTDRRNELYVLSTDNLLIDVPGAGLISIGQYPEASTGHAIGFDFGVEWGQFGFVGGVLDKSDAILLANHILDRINKENPKYQNLDA